MIEILALIVGLLAGKALAYNDPQTPEERRAKFFAFLEAVIGMMVGFALFVAFVLWQNGGL